MLSLGGSCEKVEIPEVKLKALNSSAPWAWDHRLKLMWVLGAIKGQARWSRKERRLMP